MGYSAIDHKAYMKVYYEKNKPEYRKYYRDNKDRFRTNERAWRKANPQKVREMRKRGYKKNTAAENERSRLYVAALKLKVMQAYGGKIPKCASCGCRDIRVMELDHVYNDGAQHRKQVGAVGVGFYRHLVNNNFPDKKRFQVLCKNCNYLKYANLSLTQKRKLRCK